MRSIHIPAVRTALLALGLGLSLASVHAQTPAPATTEAAPAPSEADARREAREEGRRNQRIEHIHTEDRGSAIDETRYGGRTQTITVQPLRGPAYEVRPDQSERARPGTGESGSSGTGPAYWNIFKF